MPHAACLMPLMGIIRTSPPARFVCGVILPVGYDFQPVKEKLADVFGPLEIEAGPWPFEISYYLKEMGCELERRFVSAAGVYDPTRLAVDKICSNDLEDEFRRDGIRQINLDPGYITTAQLVLASTKNNIQRVYLRDGIFAEVTLHWEKGAWQSFPWTYADYRSGVYDDFLSEVRMRLKSGERHEACGKRKTEL